MNFSPLKSFKFWFQSIKISFGIFGIIATFFTILGISINDILSKLNWHCKIDFFIIIYVLLILIITIYRFIYFQFGIKIFIKGISVVIKQGDIFKANGKKVIPLNEYFDNIVDDDIVSKKSLHGLFINNVIKDPSKMLQIIEKSNEDKTDLVSYIKNSRLAFPIGRIVKSDDFLLLSFTEFNENNEAHLTKKSFEKCLVNMWKEICRTYAQYPVNLPLLSFGVTRIDDWQDRTALDIIKIMLQTLYMSNVDIREQITITLTSKVFRCINISELKGVKFI
jgi:hypothetical protein